MSTAADVLNASDRGEVRARADRIALRLKIRRYNPEVGEESWWDEFTVECDPLDRLVGHPGGCLVGGGADRFRHGSERRVFPRFLGTRSRPRIG